MNNDAETSADEVIAQLGYGHEIDLLRKRIAAWLEGVDPELRAPLGWAFEGTQKHFRPLTMFATFGATHTTPVGDANVELAFVVELMHNMSLIVDDILDESSERRGIPTIHTKFGSLHALMGSGYLVADAFDLMADDPFAITHLAELLRRLGACALPQLLDGGVVGRWDRGCAAAEVAAQRTHARGHLEQARTQRRVGGHALGEVGGNLGKSIESFADEDSMYAGGQCGLHSRGEVAAAVEGPHFDIVRKDDG